MITPEQETEIRTFVATSDRIAAEIGRDPNDAVGMIRPLLAALDEARRERDELRLTLECEAGIRAPYGWVRTGGSWERPDVAAIGQIKPGRWAYQIKADGYKIEGHFTYALEAIRAADNATKPTEPV